MFDFSWRFKELTEDILTEKASKFQKKYSRHDSPDIDAEIYRLKMVFDVNFEIDTLHPKEIDEEIYNLELKSLFPNLLTALRIFFNLAGSLQTRGISVSLKTLILNVSYAMFITK